MAQSSVEYPERDVADLTEEAPIRVLHVDDEAGFLNVAKQILEMQGSFQVDTASSVEEAIKKMRKKRFDVVVSDYQMPEKDGLEFLKELRDGGDDVPFVLFTGKGRQEVAIKALNLGADQYLNKIGNPETVYGELAHGIRKAVERKRAVERIRASEEKYRRLVELAPDSIMTFDRKGVITSCNTASTRLSGYSKDELIGKHFAKIGPLRARDIPRYLKMLPSALRGKVPEPFEIVYRHKNGALRFGEVHVSLMRERGTIIGMQAIMRDVTKRKNMEESLKGALEKLKRTRV